MDKPPSGGELLPDEIDAVARAPGLKGNPASQLASHALPGWRIGAARFGLIRMSLLAFIVGAVTGLGAFVFRKLIAFIHNLLFLQTVSFIHDSRVFTRRTRGERWSLLCRCRVRSGSPS